MDDDRPELGRPVYVPQCGDRDIPAECGVRHDHDDTDGLLPSWSLRTPGILRQFLMTKATAPLGGK
jgi:hypothetical protein